MGLSTLISANRGILDGFPGIGDDGARHRQTGNGHDVALARVPPVLDVEGSPQHGVGRRCLERSAR
jgi:hypothetical protein